MSTVTLFDGRQVDSASADWLLETTARSALAMPTLEHRRAWLASYERRRGAAQADKVRELMKKLHEAGVHTGSHQQGERP